MPAFSGCYDYDHCTECGDLRKTDCLDEAGKCPDCSECAWEAGEQAAYEQRQGYTDDEADAAYEAAQFRSGQYWGLL